MLGALLFLPVYEYNEQGIQHFQDHRNLAEEKFSTQPQQALCHYLATPHHILLLLPGTAVIIHVFVF